MKNKEKIVTTIVITRENHAFAKKKAKEDGRSLSNFLNMLISGIKEKK